MSILWKACHSIRIKGGIGMTLIENYAIKKLSQVKKDIETKEVVVSEDEEIQELVADILQYYIDDYIEEDNKI